VHKLKPDKSDGYAGLSSDYFLQACNELFVHISLLFSRFLLHSCVPAVMALFWHVSSMLLGPTIIVVKFALHV